MISKRRKRKKELPSIVLSFIVAIGVTVIIYFDHSLEKEMVRWGNAAVLASVFFFAFSFVFVMSHAKQIKEKLSTPIKFLIISLVCSGFVLYSLWSTLSWSERFVYYSLAVGMCYSIFTILHRFDYKHIEKNIFKLGKSLAYWVLFPSMFLIIALMGKIDKVGAFLKNAQLSLQNAGQVFSDVSYKLVETIYNLGKYQYSGIFMIAAFIVFIFLALKDFFKKERLGKKKRKKDD